MVVCVCVCVFWGRVVGKEGVPASGSSNSSSSSSSSSSKVKLGQQKTR